MEENRNQVVDIPVPTADQAEQESHREAPTTVADQGLGNEAADETTLSEDQAFDSQLDENRAEALTANEAEDETAGATEGTTEGSTESAVANEAASDVQTGDDGDLSGASTAPEASGDASQGPVGQEVSSEAPPVQEPDAEAEMTMADVMSASDDQLARKPVHRGMVTTGMVIMLSQDGVIVDVGAKIEGLIPYNQLFEFELKAEEASKYIKPGDEVQVYVVRSDIPNNTIILSKKRADQEKAWNLLHEIHEKRLPVEVEIVEKVRGGLVANLGVRAFLPASQIDVRRINDLSPYVGKRLKVRIIELNRKRNRVIISRRSIIEDEIVGQKEETLKKLEPGAKLEGEIVEITDFGVFVNLGGVDGLVHRSEIGYGRFNHPREAVKVGDKVHVEVLDMDLERERINLSMKKLIADPWENVLANYSIGQRVSGVVTNLTPFGAFVEVEPGLEGLIHVSEMSWTKRVRHPKEIVTEGDHVEAMILKVDMAQKRISLGLRQTQPDPWSSLPDRYPPGTEITGPITGLTEFGVFMEIEEGIEGLIHISELAHERVDDISEHFKRGDEVTAVILNIDPIEQRASLSRKRLLPYSASEGGDTDYSQSSAQGGRQGQGGGRKGRRGGRRSSEIDYDYSYAASESGNKTTTKLGDVYADLFAQFGLATEREKTAQERAEEPAASSPAVTQEETGSERAEPEATASAPQEAQPETARPEARTDAPEASPGATEASAEAAAEDSAVDSENAIDAAEAAAMLTAAFRQGRRPASSEPEGEEDGETSPEERVEERSNA